MFLRTQVKHFKEYLLEKSQDINKKNNIPNKSLLFFEPLVLPKSAELDKSDENNNSLLTLYITNNYLMLFSSDSNMEIVFKETLFLPRNIN